MDLKKEYDNLILVDIMCHSVPSPKFFEKYKKYILKKMNASKISDINFRDKSKYGYKYPMMTVKTDKGNYSEGIDKWNSGLRQGRAGILPVLESSSTLTRWWQG